MSIEGPEARILAEQLQSEIPGHQVTRVAVGDLGRLQPSGLANRSVDDFHRLTGHRVDQVRARGNTVDVVVDSGLHLIVGAEYGGWVRLLPDGPLPGTPHLTLTFDDGRALALRLTGMGALRCDTDAELVDNYVYRRDFSTSLDLTSQPVSSGEFDALLAGKARALKSVLVGRDAIVVGVSNATFVDVLYRAGLHPKRRASDLSADERGRLREALRTVLAERLAQGGKQDFVDIYGRPGRYTAALAPGRAGTTCQRCGTQIAAIAVGGGRVPYCPGCQR